MQIIAFTLRLRRKTNGNSKVYINILNAFISPNVVFDLSAQPLFCDLVVCVAAICYQMSPSTRKHADLSEKKETFWGSMWK